MVGGDNLSKGRLRSAWTHRVEIPAHAQNDGAGQDSLSYMDAAGSDHYPQHHHHQQLHHHHNSSQLQPLRTSHSNRGTSAPGADAADSQDTPKKVQPALAFLQQTQQQLYAARGRRLFTRVDREILCNALACAGASMSDPLMSMVDSYYAGKLGTTALAALGSNGALFSVLYFLCFTALAVLCTQVRTRAGWGRLGFRPHHAHVLLTPPALHSGLQLLGACCLHCAVD